MGQLSHICLFLLLTLLLQGCSSVRYYSQAVSGQWSLLWAREPVAAILEQPDTSADLKQKLRTAVAVREFAREELALPVGGTFRDYVTFDRPYVVVNLVATPEFSLTPHQWCYPVVGCQAYRGYFDPQDAESEAREFDRRGYDTFIGGVTAYSTLGWFNDPLHSGFTRLAPDRMAALMIHELAHQVVYIPGDTTFNESFATATELEGLKIWLARSGDEEDFDRALVRLQQRNQTLELVQTTTDRLEAAYRQADTLPADRLRLRKTLILDQLREDYLALAADWPRPGPLGRNPPPLNNAHLALFRQYNQYVAAFRQLLREQNYDFAAYFEAVRRLSEQPAQERNAELESLLAHSFPP